DVGASRVVVPSGWVDSGSTVTPACSVYNYGTETETYEVRMRIGSGYNTTRTATNHAPGTYLYLTFPNWTATQRGTFATSCSTELSTDMSSSNDRTVGAVLVRLLDVGVAQITAPGTLVDSGKPVSPRVQLRNYGNVEANLNVRLTVTDTNGILVYDTTETDIVLPGGQSISRTLTKTWQPNVLGRYWLMAYTIMPGDANPANDTARDSCTVVPPLPVGWTEKKSMPSPPSNSPVKDGGWLTFDAGTNLIYAAKGNKQTDFYSYDPGLDTWLILASIPLGTEGKKPGKGAAGCADGSGHVYALKGNNTLGYYRYDAASDSWQQLVDVPLGTTKKKIKGGGGIAYAEREGSGCVFVLKGQKNEFWRWQIPAQGQPDTTTWHPVADAPGTSKWDRGSWLVWDHSGKLYAHKAKYHEFYTYDIARDSWSERLTGMPLLSRSGKSKKSKDGGCAVWFSTGIFALKGGNTSEFWVYSSATDSWGELDPLPELGSSGNKKRVKAGAGLASEGNDIYALKGNKTLELWQYHPSILLAATSKASPAHAGQLAAQTDWLSSSRLRLYPSPARTGRAQLKLGGTSARQASHLVAVAILDASGRVVHRGLYGLGSEIDVILPAGVYLARIDDGSGVTRQKLVIQH
ncbi:MAG: T9SS type A sorting domain-containing protein, partial [candidate division WOR-3 bacterium]